MTTATEFSPIIDPETGEVLAASADERRELIDALAPALVEEVLAARRARHARRILRLVMGTGDAWADPHRPGFAVAVKPGVAAKRVVVEHALIEHAESLRPLGLAPRQETKTVTVLPRVSDLTSVAARTALARLGMTPEHFLHAGLPGEPSVVVIEPEEAAAP